MNAKKEYTIRELERLTGVPRRTLSRMAARGEIGRRIGPFKNNMFVFTLKDARSEYIKDAKRRMHFKNS